MVGRPSQTKCSSWAVLKDGPPGMATGGAAIIKGPSENALYHKPEHIQEWVFYSSNRECAAGAAESSGSAAILHKAPAVRL